MARPSTSPSRVNMSESSYNVGYRSSEASPGDVMLEAAEELRAHGHPEAGQEILERAIRCYQDRSSEQAGTEAYPLGLAEALYLSGRWKEARTLIESLASEKPDKIAFQGYLGALAARRGDSKEALRISTALERLDRRISSGSTRTGALGSPRSSGSVRGQWTSFKAPLRRATTTTCTCTTISTSNHFATTSRSRSSFARRASLEGYRGTRGSRRRRCCCVKRMAP